MDRSSTVPLGRSSALFVFASMALVSAVLILSCFLSDGSSYEIPYTIVDVWVLVLSLASIVAIAAFFCLRRYSVHFTDCNESFHERKPTKRIYLIATIICGIGSSVFPIFEAIQVATCLGYDTSFQVLRFLSTLMVGIISLAEVLFITFCGKYKCNSSRSRIIVSVIMSANCYIFVNGLLDVFRSANTNKRTENTTFNFKNVLVFSHCNASGEHVDHLASKVNSYIYTFPLEFCLLAICVLGPLWNITATNITRAVDTESPERDDNDALENEMLFENDAFEQLLAVDQVNRAVGSNTVVVSRAGFCAVVKAMLQFMSRWSWWFSVLFAMTVFIFQLFVEIHDFKFVDSSPSDNSSGVITRLETANYYVPAIYMYIICTVPFFGYVVSRRGNPSRWHYDTKTVLLGVAALCHLLVVLFETVDSVSVLSHGDRHVFEKIVYFVKIVLSYFGIYFQTMLILKAGGLVSTENANPLQLQYVNGIVIFLAVCNTKSWLTDCFLTAPTLKYIEDMQGDDTFGHRNWWILTRVLYPSVAFYRLFSALMCFEILALMACKLTRSHSTIGNLYQPL